MGSGAKHPVSPSWRSPRPSRKGVSGNAQECTRRVGPRSWPKADVTRLGSEVIPLVGYVGHEAHSDQAPKVEVKFISQEPCSRCFLSSGSAMGKRWG